MRLGIRSGVKPVKKTFFQVVSRIIKSVLDAEEMRKAGGHKYVKREGGPGHYKYWYKLPDGSVGTKAQLKAAMSGKKADTPSGSSKTGNSEEAARRKRIAERTMDKYKNGEITARDAFLYMSERITYSEALKYFGLDNNVSSFTEAMREKGIDIDKKEKPSDVLFHTGDELNFTSNKKGKKAAAKKKPSQSSRRILVAAAKTITGSKKIREIGTKLFEALENGEVEGSVIGDEGQAAQLARLSILAIIGGKKNIDNKDAEKYAHVMWDKESRKNVLDWVSNHLMSMNVKPPSGGKKLGIRKPGAGENSGGFAGSVAQGDIITGKDAHTGQSITGKVTKKGRDGITVETKNGVSHHIQWEGVEKVNKVINANDAIRLLYDKAAIGTDWREAEKGMQPESCDNIGGLLKAAESDRENLNKLTGEYVNNFADLTPILIKRPVLKGIERIKEKLREDEKDNQKRGTYGELYDKETDTYHCRTIRDTDGHTITLNNAADVGKLLDAFKNDKRVIRIKNNFAKPTFLGYSDINMNVRLANGTVAEIQLNTTANLVAKERYGHSLFEVWRTINGMEGSVKEKHAGLLELMVEGQKALYGRANEYSKEGNYKLSDSVQSEINNGNAGAIFKEECQEYTSIVKPFIEKALPLFEKAVKEGLFPNTEKGEENKTIGHFKELAGRLK
jgi:hypothetical protein